MRFVVDDFGASEIAKRFGVTRYPALFVGEVLVAKPKDFGFYGRGEGAGDGRYTPFKTAESHARLQADLRKQIASALAGEARAGASSVEADALPALPSIELRDLAGQPIARDELAGKVVVVEFWATWCPPCRRTLKALEPLARELGDRLVVLALAVESDDADVREVAASHPSLRFALATPEVARAFGDVTSLPALHVFGRDGRRLSSHFGAPPGGDERLERELRAALAPSATK
ncbi:MAG: TlpA family protein disulfide reductase [Planctomycetes bacterium]|nr:TlpA family protein disulfide reductase [Planctomycetota bacterium]